MFVRQLTNPQKKELACIIRRFIEPKEHSERENYKTEESILSLLHNHSEDLIVHGIDDIHSILKSNYAKKTIERLMSKIKIPVVWDASICNLSEQMLQDLFFNPKFHNIITSLTFDEMLRIASNPAENNHLKAQFLVREIISDIDSKYCSCKMLEKTQYVDNILINYCIEHGYSLYTFDYSMGLRAKSRGISVSIFNNYHSTKTYNADETAYPIILDTDLLTEMTLNDILIAAQKCSGGKLIITQEFAEQLETKKDIDSVKEIIYFLISDYQNTYADFLPKCDNTDISDIAKDCDAIILSCNIKKCFLYKSLGCKYSFISEKANAFVKEEVTTISANGCTDTNSKSNKNAVSENATTTSTSCVHVINENIKIPHYNCKFSRFYTATLVNEKIWILDNQFMEVNYSAKNFRLENEHIIVHGTNCLNDSYTIAVYKVVSSSTGIAQVIYQDSFFKGTVDYIDKKYRDFAKKLLLTT